MIDSSKWANNKIAIFLANRIADSFFGTTEKGRTPRVICPVCTRELALAVHMHLRKRKVNSVLVAEKSQYPVSIEREEICITDVDKMVSFRLDPVVYVLEPGLLPLVPQSLRGTGGTSLKLEIPERWPLESEDISLTDLCEYLAVVEWKLDDDDRQIVQNVIGSLLVPSLLSRPDGPRLLIEEFLSDNSSAAGSARGYCAQVGVLWHEGFSENSNRAPYKMSDIQAVAVALRDASKAADVLGYRLADQFPNDSKAEIDEKVSDLRTLVDGLVNNSHLFSGFLSLSTGLSRAYSLRGPRTEWVTFEVLRDLLELNTSTQEVSVEISRIVSDAILIGDVSCPPLVLSIDDVAELITVDIDFEVENDEFELRLKIGRKIVRTQALDATTRSVSFDISVHEVADYGASAAKKIVAEILRNGEVVERDNVEVAILDSSSALVHLATADGKSKLVFPGVPQIFRPDTITSIRILIGEDLAGESSWHLDGERLTVQPDHERDRIFELLPPLDPNQLRASESLLEIEVVNTDSPEESLYFEISLVTGEASSGFISLDALLEYECSRFRRKLSSGFTEARAPFLGNESSFLRRLGVPKSGVSRLSFCRYFEAPASADEYPFSPLVTDLFCNDDVLVTSFDTSKESAYLKIAKSIKSNPFSIHGTASKQMQKAMRGYGSARAQVILLATEGSASDVSGLPKFCSTPLYCDSAGDRMEGAISNYLKAYLALLDFALDGKGCFFDRFLALNLDCVVSISEDPSYKPYSDIRLIGPWHPLVVVQRYLYQKALVQYAVRISESDISNFDIFPKLTPLLRSSSQIAYVLASLGQNPVQYARLVTQGDSGWIVAIPESAAKHLSQLKSENPIKFSEGASLFHSSTGFELLAEAVTVSESVGGMIGKYIASSPAVNRIGIRFGAGFDVDEIVSDLAVELRGKEGIATELMNQLPGGVDLLFDGLRREESEVSTSDIAEADLPIRLHTILSPDSEEVEVADVSFLSPRGGAGFDRYHQDFRRDVVRGTGDAYLLSRRPRQIRTLADKVESVGPTYESLALDESSELERYARQMCSSLQSVDLVGYAAMDTFSGVLAPRPTGRWEYLSGDQFDPAILVDYLSRNSDRSLWDFQFGIGQRGKESHYVLSKHNTLLLSAMKAILKEAAEPVEDILLEMSKIGSPLLRESNGTTNKAKGCAGLVAAKRLIPMERFVNAGLIPILLPIDSFDGIVGHGGSSGSESDTRMADLLLLVFSGVSESSSVVEVQATAIEAKYRTLVPSSASSYFDQTGQTYERVERLFASGVESEFLPCRIALTEMVEFGLRLGGVSSDIVVRILNSIIQGSYEWRSGNLSSLVTILTPQTGIDTEFSKSYDGGWKAVMSTSNFPSANGAEDLAVDSIRDKIFHLISDVPHVQNLEGVRLDSDQSKEQKLNADLRASKVLLNESYGAASSSNSSMGATGSHVTSSEQIEGSAQRDRFVSGYTLVAELLEEWKVVLEKSDVAAMMRNTPSCYRYQYRLVSSKDISKASRADFLTAIKYKLALDESANIRVGVARGYLVFEIGKNKEDRYAVYADELWGKVGEKAVDLDRLAIAIGESVTTGEPVVVDFKKLPHLLIAGQTGAGKSVAIETIVEGLTRFYPPDRLELSIVDLKGVDFLRYEGTPHLVSGIVKDRLGALQLLGGLVKTTDERMKLFAKNRVKNLAEFNAEHKDSPLPYKLVVIDEFAELVLDEDVKKEIIRFVQSIAQKSRAAGTHLIICTQYPRGDVVDRLITANLPGRLCLKVPDRTASGLVLNESGAENLSVDGDALYQDGASEVVRLQVAIVRD